ncbi:nicotinate phosphoribosyltransferase [Rhodococcoides fascians]|uniref:nicotinate phosphoribosyltransferase n=1 Tax=Rhodococcoides fascians TaxID=1828 RepID=UPI00055DC85A|nr:MULTISPECIES: nicotinate phosphoribosyltransferase [Rhodococcus]OZD72898.1 nicotinate phosphoribosyltransferase [Rhodococcus sp. 06-1059B-a]OZF00981.1 nicotinate phosphoribosyltransferase [Rhodococcus sp. 15-1154-1]
MPTNSSAVDEAMPTDYDDGGNLHTVAPAPRNVEQVPTASNHGPDITDSIRSAALFTDQYEFTMLSAALADGTADIPCSFEVFARRLPGGRRYGVVAGTARFLGALTRFRFGEEELEVLGTFLDASTLEWLRNYRFTGDVDGYREGDLYFPGSPILSVRGTFAECVILETLALSILNHDSAIASAAARMVGSAGSRHMIEMGSRRTHEEAAVASSRAAYIAGFAATSNLEAVRRHGIPGAGTSAHAFTLLYNNENGPDEKAAFAAQVRALGVSTTLLVDTYDITQGVANAIEVAGPELGGVRIDSGDLGVLARQVRQQLDDLGAKNTKIVVSGDLDEYAIAALRAEPVDSYGVGTSLVTGSGAPTAGMVYKLVTVDGRPVAKRSSHKESRGGAKSAVRTSRTTGTAVEEIVFLQGTTPPIEDGLVATELSIPLVRAGEQVDGLGSLHDARALLAQRLVSLPWEGLKLSQGEPALPTRFV